MSAIPSKTRPSATPILDRSAPLPEPARGGQSRRLGLSVLVGLLLAALALWILQEPALLELLRSWLQRHFPELFAEEWSDARALAALLALLIALPLAIAVHEVGHLLGGLLAGFRFSALRIGPLQIDRPFRLSFQRMSGTGYAGWASMFPVKRDHLRLRALVLVAGGPGINLLSAGVFFFWPYQKGFFSVVFIVISVGLALRELLPIRHRTAVSDGRRIFLMLRDRAWNARWLALMKLGEELERGLLPEAWSADWLAAAVAYRDDSSDTVAAHGMAYAAAFHRREDDEAAGYLEIALGTSAFAASALREALMSDAAVFQARRRRRVDLAEAWLSAMPQRPLAPWLRTRVEAAIHEARGDTAGALEKLDEVEEAIRARPDRARREFMLRLTERWRSEVRAQRAAPERASR